MGENVLMPAYSGFHVNRSIAAYNCLLSFVNCCSAPIPAPVRMIAARSPACICSSTNFFNACLTDAVLPNDNVRSSTTKAIVLLTCSGLSGTGGAGAFATLLLSVGFGAAIAAAATAGLAVTYEKLVMRCG